jgi:hypothetical protein
LYLDLYLDSTFLTAADRQGNTHATIEEVAQKCTIAGVLVAYALHLPIRYSLIPYDEITYLN